MPWVQIASTSAAPLALTVSAALTRVPHVSTFLVSHGLGLVQGGKEEDYHIILVDMSVLKHTWTRSFVGKSDSHLGAKFKAIDGTVPLE